LKEEPIVTRENPEHPIVAVGVIVWKGGKVLVVRRGKAPRDGQWSIPGGAQEVGETVRETAVREVREETGLEIAVTGLVDVVDFIEPDGGDGVRFHYTLVDLGAEWLAGDPIPDSDVAEAEWADVADLDRYEMWSETRRVIDKSAVLRAATGRTVTDRPA
jgi:8-oxo-dGTP diphosphatase